MIDYGNRQLECSKTLFTVKYILNIIRTWYLFNMRFPWVKYDGFARIMRGTRFDKKEISLGNNVQFGHNCHIGTSTTIGNNVLIADDVKFLVSKPHGFDVPGKTIWSSPVNSKGFIQVEDDVWICDGALIFSDVKIGAGSIISARSVVTKDVPPCEIWGGVPAKKIRDRFATEDEKMLHLRLLQNR